jgi:hypothetical protein
MVQSGGPVGFQSVHQHPSLAQDLEPSHQSIVIVMAMGDHNGIDITEMVAPALQLSRYGRQRFLAMNTTVNKGQIPLFSH